MVRMLEGLLIEKLESCFSNGTQGRQGTFL